MATRLAHELGASPSVIGLVVGASTVTGIFVKMPAGALSDVLGRRPLLLAGALVFALMPFAYLGASTLAALIVLRVVHGCATAIFGPVAHAAQFVLNGALSAFLPLYGRDVVGLTTPQLGWLFAGQTVTTLAIRPFIGSMSDRGGRRGVIVAGLALCSIAVGALSVTTNSWVLAATVMTYAAGVATTTAATSAFITDVSRRARYGAAHGVFGTIYDIGDAAGPIGAGVLVATIGYGPMFRTLAVFGLIMAMVFAVASRPGPSPMLYTEPHGSV